MVNFKIEKTTSAKPPRISKYKKIPFVETIKQDVYKNKHTIYATINWTKIEIISHFFPISCFKADIVARQGEYRRQNAIKEIALAGVKNTALVGLIKLFEMFW